MLGINGKNSELHAAMGLSVLPHMPAILEKRKELSLHYDTVLKNLRMKKQVLQKEAKYNYSYYPVVFEDEAALLRVQKALNEEQIFPRRYFYPSLNTINYIERTSMPISESVASRILCLPLYVELQKNDLQQIVSILNTNV